ncbi:uncharacterized protein ARMOST_20894 [Armillaria ostoyae]|uniref:Uncharacterized protein n=1 Tax=Armillaria ostoyae TaxID=47428 RepID=A0A284S8L7_ARMOS|nr:uncharacterized protein ARMOST_20894 [Armillaria ostoyae]
MSSTFYDRAEDILIAFLSPRIFFSDNFKRFCALTRLHVVWTNTVNLDILAHDYPYLLYDTDLEHRTCHAYRLVSRWLADSSLTRKGETTFIGSLKCSEWLLKGAIFTGVKLSADPESEPSVVASSSQSVLLHLDGHGILPEIRSIDTDLRPAIIALSDDVSKTVIYNWKTEEHAHLDDVGDNQHDHCLQTPFRSQRIILLHLGDTEPLHEICSIKINLCPVNITGDIIVLSDNASKTLVYNCKTVRAYLDDVCIQHDRCLQVVFTPLHTSAFTCIATHSFSLVEASRQTHPNIIPYLSLNPRLQNIFATVPRCTNVILGKWATTAWIRTHDHALVSHSEEHNECETLIAAVLTGPLNSIEQVRKVCMNSLNNWTAFDLDGDLGRIALGSGFGIELWLAPYNEQAPYIDTCSL